LTILFENYQIYIFILHKKIKYQIDFLCHLLGITKYYNMYTSTNLHNNLHTYIHTYIHTYNVYEGSNFDWQISICFRGQPFHAYETQRPSSPMSALVLTGSNPTTMSYNHRVLRFLWLQRHEQPSAF
jgi:hypothetical protein